MPIPHNVVAQWSEFIAEWCLGIEPVDTPVEVERAFDALRRLWPEALIELDAQDSRGISVVLPAISRGLTLVTCEGLTGFEKVMDRLRGGEKSALAELQFAQALIRCGFTPVLEPEIGGKTPDCLVGIGSERVFAEVIAPEQSADIRDATDTVRSMAAEIVERTMGTRTEVLLSVSRSRRGRRRNSQRRGFYCDGREGSHPQRPRLGSPRFFGASSPQTWVP